MTAQLKVHVCSHGVAPSRRKDIRALTKILIWETPAIGSFFRVAPEVQLLQVEAVTHDPDNGLIHVGFANQSQETLRAIFSSNTGWEKVTEEQL